MKSDVSLLANQLMIEKVTLGALGFPRTSEEQRSRQPLVIIAPTNKEQNASSEFTI
jgi:hypothetical protein